MYDEWARWIALGYPARTLGYGPAEDTVALALGVLARLPEPFFLFVHLHEPHDPHEAPAPFQNKYAPSGRPADRARVAKFFYRRYPPDMQPLVDAERDHYDESLEYLDSEIGKLVTVLEKNTANTLLLVTGDHGESFERGFLNHGEDLYESSIHVPLLIRLPGQKAARRVDVPAQSVDIAPTILASAGIAAPVWMDGVALENIAGIEERETIAVNFKDPAQGKVYKLPTRAAIRRGAFKLIVSCDSGRAELYDLVRDPAEENNLARSMPRVAQDLWRKLDECLGKGTVKMPCRFAPDA